MGQPFVISVTSTKGGVSKTTVTANLGAMLADFGMRVLLIDADIQPALTKYFDLEHRAQSGLCAVITSGGRIDANAISRTFRPNLHLIASDTPDWDKTSLQTWLKDRDDRLVIMKRAVQSPYVRENYDVILIDTQGAVGELQKTAAMAANIMIAPVEPSMLAAREFASGTLAMLESLNQLADFSAEFRSGDLYALISNYERSTDCRLIAEQLRNDFRSHHSVRVLKTVIPHATAYRQAVTFREPAYDRDRPPSRKETTAYETLHNLVWELFPNLEGQYFDAKPIETEASA